MTIKRLGEKLNEDGFETIGYRWLHRDKNIVIEYTSNDVDNLVNADVFYTEDNVQRIKECNSYEEVKEAISYITRKNKLNELCNL